MQEQAEDESVVKSQVQGATPQKQMQRYDSKYHLAMLTLQNLDARAVKDKQKRERQQQYHQQQKEIHLQRQIDDYKNRMLKQWKSADHNSPIRQYNKNYAPIAKKMVPKSNLNSNGSQKKLVYKPDRDEISPRSILRIQVPKFENTNEYNMMTDETLHQPNTADDQRFILQQNQQQKMGESLLNSFSDQVSERPLDPVQLKLDTLQSDTQSDEVVTNLKIGMYKNNASAVIQKEKSLLMQPTSQNADDSPDYKQFHQKSGLRTKKVEQQMVLSPKFQMFSSELFDKSDNRHNEQNEQRNGGSTLAEKYFPVQKKGKNATDDQLDDIIKRKYSNPISELERTNSLGSNKDEQQPKKQQVFPNINTQFHTINHQEPADVNFANLRLSNQTQLGPARHNVLDLSLTSPQNRQNKILQDIQRQVEALNSSGSLDGLVKSHDSNNYETSHLRASLDIVNDIKKNSISTLIASRPLETIALNDRIRKKDKKGYRQYKKIQKIEQKYSTKMMFHVPSPLDQGFYDGNNSYHSKRMNPKFNQPRIFRALKTSSQNSNKFQTSEERRSIEYSHINYHSKDVHKGKNKSIFQKIDGYSINEDLNMFQTLSNSNKKQPSKHLFQIQANPVAEKSAPGTKEIAVRSPGKNHVTEIASEGSSVLFTKLGTHSNQSNDFKSLPSRNNLSHIKSKVGSVFKANNNKKTKQQPQTQQQSPLGTIVSNDTITDMNFNSTLKEGRQVFGKSPMNTTKHDQKFKIKVLYKKSNYKLDQSEAKKSEEEYMRSPVGQNQYLNGQMSKFNIELLNSFNQDQIKFFLGGYKCVQHQRMLAQRKAMPRSRLKHKNNMVTKHDTMLNARGTQYLLKDHSLIDESCASDSYAKSQKDYFELEDQNHKPGNQSIKVNFRSIAKNEHDTDQNLSRKNSDINVLLDEEKVPSKEKEKEARQSQSSSSVSGREQTGKRSQKQLTQEASFATANLADAVQNQQLNDQLLVLQNNQKISDDIQSSSLRKKEDAEVTEAQKQTPKSTLLNSPYKSAFMSNAGSPQIIHFANTIQQQSFQMDMKAVSQTKLRINEGIQSSTLHHKRSKAVLSKVNLQLNQKEKSQMRSSNFSSNRSKENSNLESYQPSLLNVTRFKMIPRVQNNELLVRNQRQSSRYLSPNVELNQHRFLAQIKSSKDETTDEGTFRKTTTADFEPTKTHTQMNKHILVQHNDSKTKEFFKQSLSQQPTPPLDDLQFNIRADLVEVEDWIRESQERKKQNVGYDQKQQIQKIRTKPLHFDPEQHGRGSPLSHVVNQDTDYMSPYSHEILEKSPEMKITPYQKTESAPQQQLQVPPNIRPYKLKVVDINEGVDQQIDAGYQGHVPFVPIPSKQQIQTASFRSLLANSPSNKSLMKNLSKSRLLNSFDGLHNVSNSWHFDERLRPYMQVQGLFQGIQSPIEQFENRRIVTGQNIESANPSPYQSRQYLHDMDQTGELRMMRGIYEVVNRSIDGTSNQINILKNNMNITQDGSGQQNYPRPNLEQKKKINDRYNQMYQIMLLKKKSTKNSMRMSSQYSSIYKTHDETTSQGKSQHGASMNNDHITDSNSQTDTAFVINKSENQVTYESQLGMGKQSLLQQISNMLSPTTMKLGGLTDDSPDNIISAEVELLAANDSFKGMPPELQKLKTSD